MWHDRGDGSYRPVGMVQYLFAGPSLALLSDQQAPFPALQSESDFMGKGYVLEERTGRPIFKYVYKGIAVEDKIIPEDDDRIFTREVKFSRTNGSGFYYKLAEGNDISTLRDGTYIIGDKSYFIKVLSPVKPLVRDQPHGLKELLIPVDGSEIKYSIIW
jgi:hypothetical protein